MSSDTKGRDFDKWLVEKDVFGEIGGEFAFEDFLFHVFCFAGDFFFEHGQSDVASFFGDIFLLQKFRLARDNVHGDVVGELFNSGFFATKSVSHASSTMAPTFPVA